MSTNAAITYLITILLLFCSHLNPAHALITVCYDPGFALMRTCAAYCIACDPRPDQIAYAIGCGSNPENECWCRTDLFTLATSALSSCVVRSCTIGGWENDYASAENFYTSYCERAGYTGDRGVPADVGASTTPAPGGGGVKGPTVTRFVTVTPGATSRVTPSDGGEGGLSLSDKIALGVGIGIGLPRQRRRYGLVLLMGAEVTFF